MIIRNYSPSPIAWLAISLFILPFGHSKGLGAEPPKPDDVPPQAASDKFGLNTRTPWTTSRVTGSPDPAPPFRAESAFPKIKFEKPVVITAAPGSDRLFVGEQGGRIYSFKKDRDAVQPDPFLDVRELVDRELKRRPGEALSFEAVYGLTFHPRFGDPASADGAYCYVCYVVNGEPGKQRPDGTRVSRFRVTKTDPPRCEPDSEEILITWLAGGHNGGCLQFGPDGFLYISTGDGGPAFPPDSIKTGQDVSDLLSAVLRLDVEHRDVNRNYKIPTDNPFIDLPGARGEIWCYGLRNPWKMSFDRATGDLWVGDVGWELWELVFRVEKGGNYGWSIAEGRQPVHPDRKVGPTPISPPTIDIPHSDGVSITGGHVYRGSRFPELVGRYIFGDWESRRVWAAPWDTVTKMVGETQDILEPTVRLVAFAEDNDGELLLLDYDDGRIYELARNTNNTANPAFPTKLSETGLWENVERNSLSSGVIPFFVNSPQWSDYALAERFVAVPGVASIGLRKQKAQIEGSMFASSIEFPKDSVLGKTLSLEMEHGNPSSRQRIETQILHFDGRLWRAYSYRWSNDQTDAELVDRQGEEASFNVVDSSAPGGRRAQMWRFSSRAECARCHNQWAEHALAFNIRQLNRECDFSGTIDNQLRAFDHIGLLKLENGGPENRLPALTTRDRAWFASAHPRLADPSNNQLDVNERARSYLHANCAHCHRNGGGGTAYIELQHELAIDATKSIDVRPTQGSFEISDARIIAPGDPFRSTLFYRISKMGAGRMPHIGSELVDVSGVNLIHDWIRQLPVRSEESSLIQSLVASGSGPIKKVNPPSQADRDHKHQLERVKTISRLLSSTSRALVLVHAMQRREIPADANEEILNAAVAHPQASIRDLFEQFLPPERRPQRLGINVKPSEILALHGDAERGRVLFFENSVLNCKSCHRLNDIGNPLGPDLGRIGNKYDRKQILESILEPSKAIDPKFVGYLVTTSEGQRFTGLLLSRDASQLRLRDIQNQELQIPIDKVDEISPQRISLMPELLARDLTAGQLADLLAFLAGLKSDRSD